MRTEPIQKEPLLRMAVVFCGFAVGSNDRDTHEAIIPKDGKSLPISVMVQAICPRWSDSYNRVACKVNWIKMPRPVVSYATIKAVLAEVRCHCTYFLISTHIASNEVFSQIKVTNTFLGKHHRHRKTCKRTKTSKVAVKANPTNAWN